MSSPIEGDKADNGRLLPMTTKASSNDESYIEYGKRFQVPEWVDMQEEIECHIEEMQSKSKDLPHSSVGPEAVAAEEDENRLHRRR